MGDHRAEIGPESRPPTGKTPYVGKRVARSNTERTAPLTPPTYVGKRVARPAQPEPQLVPEPRRSAETKASTAMQASTETSASVAVGSAATAVPSIETTHGAVAVETAPLERVGRDETPGETTSEFDAIIAREAVAGLLETDFSHDQTATMPMVDGSSLDALAALGGKRRAVRSTGRRLRSIPSMPLVAGLAVLAVSATGAVTTAGPEEVRPTASPIVAAGALSGSSAAGLASELGDRQTVVSRGGGRSAGPGPGAATAPSAEVVAQTREAALGQLDQQASGQAEKLAANQWELPLPDGVYRLTARFGQYGLWASSHTGLDFAAPSGTPIKAVAGGVVTSASYDGAYGNKTVITLEDGTEIWYCHQTSFEIGVGDEVRAGDLIGYVGSTGNSTGPHLHLEVRPGGGDPVDPYSALVHEGVTP